MPVNTALKPIDLKPGDRVHIEYGTTMTRINYREISAGRDGKYSRVTAHPQSAAPSGFWAEATVTSKDGSKRTIDVTPDEYRKRQIEQLRRLLRGGVVSRAEVDRKTAEILGRS